MRKFIKKVLADYQSKRVHAQNKEQIELIHKGLEDRGY